MKGNKYNNSSGGLEGEEGPGQCYRQAPSVEFSELISRAVTAILNPIGHTVCLRIKNVTVSGDIYYVVEYLLVNRLNRGSFHNNNAIFEGVRIVTFGMTATYSPYARST